MASRLNPYLMFDGNARAALTFYQEVFGGELTLNTFGQYNPTAANADKIMHGQLDTPAGYTLMGTDNNGREPAAETDSAAVSVSGDDAEELRGYWEKLSNGAQIDVPLTKQAWGDDFGMCTDTYGIRWLVNITAPNE